MSYKPPSPERTARDVDIVRLYATMTASQIAARLGTTENTVKAVVKREGLVKGKGVRRMKVPHGSAARPDVDDSEHAAFCARVARSSQRMLLRLHAFHTAGEGEKRLKPGSPPRMIMPDVSGSIMGSGAAQCVDDRWGAGC